MTLAGCSAPPPAVPAAPVRILSPIDELVVSGLPALVTYGQSVQLTAVATLSNGARKQTLDASWQSSDNSVATVSDTGLLRVTGFGEADITATLGDVHGSAHVTTPPAPPPPAARLAVTIDEHGSSVALSSASEVAFDMSRSTGFGLRYVVEFGDGTSSSSDTASTKHIYGVSGEIGRCGLPVYTARATVTDVIGRTDTVTETIHVTSLDRHSGHATWSNGSRFVRILSQDGSNLSGDSWFPVTALTGTLSVGGDIHLSLGDGSIGFDGPVIMKDSWNDGGACFTNRHMLLKVRGGPDDGSTVDLKYYEPY